MARWQKGESSRNIVVFGFWASVAWCIGFVTPWVVKWILTRALLPPEVNLLGEALSQYPAKNMAMVGEALFKDLNYTLWPLWMMVFIVLGVRYYKLKLKQPKGIGVLLLPAIVPIIWISLLPGQSGIKHAFFVEIILWPTLASILFFLLALTRKTVSNEFPLLQFHPSSIFPPKG